MMPPPGPATPFTPGQFKKMVEATAWELDIDFMVGRDTTTQITDEDMVTSIASEETVCWSGSTLHMSRTHELGPRHVLEEHELGPSTMMNPGPPFKVGDVILCNIPGHLWGMDPMVNWLQREFVMEADHPCYKIRMEKEATVWTNTR